MLTPQPGADGAAPAWVYAAGVLIFLYQTLDGSDGKQARATGTGSALGELFDHGVDSDHRGLNRGVRAGRGARLVHRRDVVADVSRRRPALYLSNCSLVAFGRQQFFDVGCARINSVSDRTMPVLRGSWSDVSAALDDHRSLCCMVLELPAAIWKLRDTEYLGRRCKGPRGHSGRRGHQRGDDQTGLGGALLRDRTISMLHAAAAGDLSRRLLLQLAADLPEIVALSRHGVVVVGLGVVAGAHALLVAAAVSLASTASPLPSTVAATAGALGVNALTVPSVRRSQRCGRRGSSTRSFYFNLNNNMTTSAAA